MDVVTTPLLYELKPSPRPPLLYELSPSPTPQPPGQKMFGKGAFTLAKPGTGGGSAVPTQGQLYPRL